MLNGAIQDDIRVIEELSRQTGVTYSEEQLNILKYRGGMCILACAGSGKALTSDMGVLTPGGYVPIGQIKVGDTCYDENGQIQTVIGVYPQGKREVYEVIFSDDVIIKCSKDHLWAYYKGNNRDLKVRTLEYILNHEELVRNSDYNIYVPIVKPIEFSMPITSKSKDAAYELGRKIAKLEFKTGFILGEEEFSWDKGLVREHNELHISTMYRYGKIEDRLNLLKGLADATGEDKEDYSIIALNTKSLVEDVTFIAETLGFIVYCHESKANERERLGNYILRIEKNGVRAIKGIVKTGTYEDMVCIKVSSESGLFLTEHCVVTHNTTILTHLLAKRIKTGEISNVNKLLCTTFSKAGSMEMEDRLDALLRKIGISQKVQVKTLHAAYYMILRQFGLAAGVCSNAQRQAFVSAAIKEAGVMLEDEDIQLVDSLLSFQINNLLSDSDLVQSYVYTLDNVSLEKYTQIRQNYNKLKEKARVIDFDDMQLYMYCLMVRDKRQDVIEYVRNMWEYFFIDEFQDVSKIQFAILREMVTDPNKLVVIGDDDQCIYQWRGADPNIILNICGYYDIKRFVLSTNYRCAGEIVKHAAVGIKNNEKRAEKTMIPYNSGGRIRICDAGDRLFDMSKVCLQHIMNVIKSREFRVSDIAILSRNNQHLSILNNMLFDNGIYTVSAPEMRLSNMAMYKDIKNVLTLAENTYNHHVVNAILWKCCVYLGTKGAKIFANFMDTVGCSIKDALGYILSSFAYRRDEVDWRGKIKVPQRVVDKLQREYHTIRLETEGHLILVYKCLNQPNEVERVADLLQMYLVGSEFMYNSEDKQRTVHGLVDYMGYLIRKKGLAETKSFLRLSEQYESGTMEIPGEKITLATMHGAKGREWNHVILFADDNVTIPSFEGIKNMQSKNVGLPEISGVIDEGRRLHYVAMTRAKKDLTIFADRKNLSAYTLEALGLLSKQGTIYNRHIITMTNYGSLPRELVNILDEKVFTEGSPYYYRVELGDGNALTNNE